MTEEKTVSSTITHDENKQGRHTRTGLNRAVTILVAIGVLFSTTLVFAGLGVATLSSTTSSTALTPPTEQWNRTVGGDDRDFTDSIVETADGGFLAAGKTASFGAGFDDAWLLKVDATGNEQWNKTYGGRSQESAREIVPAHGDGFVFAGSTASFAPPPRTDAWLVKVDANGIELWNQSYGRTELNGLAQGVVATSDGGYLLVGWIGDEGFIDTTSDGWLVKVDANGTQEWNRTYGGADEDVGWGVVETSDGYVFAGTTKSFGGGDSDAWLVKVDANGDAVWNRTYGDAATQVAWDVTVTTDGGFALGGGTAVGSGDNAFWLVKVDADGNEEWSQTYNGPGTDVAKSVIVTSDAGYALAGIGSNLPWGSGGTDFWLVKTDANGNEQWNVTAGDGSSERPEDVIETSDGGYALAGSKFADLDFDAFLVKFAGSGLTVEDFETDFKGCSEVWVVFNDDEQLPVDATIRVYNAVTDAEETVDLTIGPVDVERIPGQYDDRPVFKFNVHDYFDRDEDGDDKLLAVSAGGSSFVENPNRCAHNTEGGDDTDGNGNGNDAGTNGTGNGTIGTER